MAAENFALPAMGLDAENVQVDPLPGAKNRVVADGAGLHAALDHVAHHEQDVGVPAAVFDAHDGHVAAALLADHQRAAGDGLVERLPAAVQQRHVVDETG